MHEPSYLGILSSYYYDGTYSNDTHPKIMTHVYKDSLMHVKYGISNGLFKNNP